MKDRILQRFLERQYEEGMALAAASDLVELMPLGDHPPQRYLARFHCTGLAKADDGQIVEVDDFVVGLWFRDEHLRSVDPSSVATILRPLTMVHPNVRFPFVCLGHIGAGVGLVDLVYQLFEVITWGKVNLAEPLNGEVAAWARRNPDRYPVDHRPLKRRADAPASGGGADFTVVEVEP